MAMPMSRELNELLRRAESRWCGRARKNSESRELPVVEYVRDMVEAVLPRGMAAPHGCSAPSSSPSESGCPLPLPSSLGVAVLGSSAGPKPGKYCNKAALLLDLST